MGKQIEALEDEADLGPLACHVAVGEVVKPAAGFAPADALAVDPDLAAGRALEKIHAAQQGRLARAAGSDDGDALALGELEVDALQHFQGAEALMQIDDADEGGHGPGSRGPSRLR